MRTLTARPRRRSNPVRIFEPLESRLLLATFPVTSLADAGPGTMRQAILDANASPGTDAITAAGDARSGTVRLQSPLPAVTGPVGMTGPLVLDGAGAGEGARGLVVEAGARATQVVGITLTNFGANGLSVAGPDVYLATVVVQSNGHRPGSGDPAHAAGIRVLGGGGVLLGSVRGTAPVHVYGNAGDGVYSDGGFVGAYVGRIGGAGALGNGGAGIHVGGGGRLDVDAWLSNNPLTMSLQVMNNRGDGVLLASGATARIAGGDFGTDGRGGDFGNGYAGVRVMGRATAVLELPRIMYNDGPGVAVEGVGTAVTRMVRTISSRNGQHGVAVTHGASASVGGPSAPIYGYWGNTLTDNGGDGVRVQGPREAVQSAPPPVLVAGNEITRNAGDGVALVDADGVVVGPSRPYSNTIADNRGDGVSVRGDGYSRLGGGRGNVVAFNSIYGNGGLGIDLGGFGPTPNDAGDIDTGPNALLNHPVITSVTRDARTGGLTVAGTMHTAPNTAVALRFFSDDPTTFGAGGAERAAEGRLPVGSTTVTTDAAGNAAFNATFTFDPFPASNYVRPPNGWVVTGTASVAVPDLPSQEGPAIPPADTSEFSPGVPIRGDAPLVSELYLNGSAWSQPFRDAMERAGAGSALHGQPILPYTGLPARPADPIPWVGADEVRVLFSRDVRVESDDLTVTGLSGARYGVTSFHYDPATHAATWRLNRPVGFDRVEVRVEGDAGGVADAQDGVALDGDRDPSAQPGGDYRRAFVVTPGDITADGKTNALDVAAVKQRLGTSATGAPRPVAPYTIFHDVDGSGRVDALDLAAVKRSLVNQPPGWPPDDRAAATPPPSITAALFGDRRLS